MYILDLPLIYENGSFTYLVFKYNIIEINSGSNFLVMFKGIRTDLINKHSYAEFNTIRDQIDLTFYTFVSQQKPIFQHIYNIDGLKNYFIC